MVRRSVDVHDPHRIAQPWFSPRDIIFPLWKIRKLTIDGGNQHPIDWTRPRHVPLLVDIICDSFLVKMKRVLLKDPRVVLGELYPNVLTLNVL